MFLVNRMKTVNIYTDGACRGNPGDGGWGALVEYQDFSKGILVARKILLIIKWN